ncbi:MAG: endonuclease/exonuclease/phosphatase family protein, partial [Deltaproteobacteria bacterium]|nr:endonuclease/exonuclease/phosphatase family protein [Deltaproteobacteria bacterium]
FSLPLIPLYSGAQPPLPRHWPELRILYANVQTSNRDKESLLHLINNEQPDIIALLETDQAWVDAVSKGVTGYPLQISKPRTDNFGMAVFSRLPLAGEIRNFGDELPPSFSIPLKRANGGELRLIVLHCIPPLTQDALYLNWLLLRRAASDLRFSDVPTLIVGDLNATPYSRFFRDFQDWAALNYGWQGRGWTPTWNVKFPPIQLMIDHVFSKGSIVITEINTGREIGSDHLPLIIKAALPKSF